MIILQEHLPQVRDASEEESWGFTLWEFISSNWIYLLAVLFILAVFFYARYNWRKRHEK
ncbi:hypothetical protein RM553_12225 [Zunongwangia sp. F363]|uniref:ATP synthase F0 subunit 8 n=1 Tax=Autumnicola tepida TaxID=3075595 RepID=A0ABU3CB88_9FLAO|nr:hypothetical protein [Zunongwangia sp. F363]MDT0643601.1 hypothetical protein [Zunongwangia sp. F363]